MKFSIDKQERYTVFTLNEDNLNSTLAPKLKSEFTLLSQEGIPNLIFDMSNIKIIDSAGLSSILIGDRAWKDLGSFVLTGVQPYVSRIIQIAKLDKMLVIVPTFQECLDYIEMEEIQRNLIEEE